MNDRTITGLVVAGGSIAMIATMGRAVSLLVVALVASYAIWLTRSDWAERRGVLPLFVTATLVQCIHLAEEIWSGFYRVFPPVMGGEPWSERQFVVFNVAWLAVFCAGAIGLRRKWRPAYVVSLFLAIGGGIGNALGHIALAIRANGYFPGAYTSPVVLVVGVALLVSHRPRAVS